MVLSLDGAIFGALLVAFFLVTILSGYWDWDSFSLRLPFLEKLNGNMSIQLGLAAVVLVIAGYIHFSVRRWASTRVMRKLIDEIKYDLSYLKSHTLQPKWFKILKVLILLGVMVGYYSLFGATATILFFVTFFILMLIVHFTYRIKTNMYTTSWLEFVVIEDGGELKTNRIGKYYYSAIIVNAIISLIVSQVLT